MSGKRGRGQRGDILRKEGGGVWFDWNGTLRVGFEVTTGGAVKVELPEGSDRIRDREGHRRCTGWSGVACNSAVRWGWGWDEGRQFQAGRLSGAIGLSLSIRLDLLPQEAGSEARSG